MNLDALKINGTTSSLNGVLAACVAIMSAGKISQAAWWVCLWIVVIVSAISIIRAGIALLIRITTWWKRRALP